MHTVSSRKGLALSNSASSLRAKVEGFTVIELLVVFTIMAILSIAGFASFSSYSRNQLMVSTMQDMKTMLYSARSLTLAQVNQATSCYHGQCNCSQGQVFGGYAVLFCSTSCVGLSCPSCISDTTVDHYELDVTCGGVQVGSLDSKKLPSQVTFAQGSTSRAFSFMPLTGLVHGIGTIAIAGYNQIKSASVSETGVITELSTILTTPTPGSGSSTPTPGVGNPTASPPPGSTPTPTPTPSSTVIVSENFATQNQMTADGWKFNYNPTGNSPTYSTNFQYSVLGVTVNNPTSVGENYRLQLYKDSIPVLQGKTYHISVDLASVNSAMVGMGLFTNNWSQYLTGVPGGNASVPAGGGSQWATYGFDYTSASNQSVLLELSLGSVNGLIYVGTITITQQ